MNRAKRIRKEHQYIEGYARCLESKIVEWHESGNVEPMWEQVKRAMVGSRAGR